MADKFDKLNRETREFRNRQVDRFNPSTRSNYNYFDPYSRGYGCYEPNGHSYNYSYSGNSYTDSNENGRGWYDGRGQYHRG